MRFEEVYDRWTEDRLTQHEAADVLGVCERQFRRQCRRYEVLRLVAQYRDRYVGWTVKHFYSKYREQERAAVVQLRTPDAATRRRGHSSQAARRQNTRTGVTVAPPRRRSASAPVAAGKSRRARLLTMTRRGVGFPMLYMVACSDMGYQGEWLILEPGDYPVLTGILDRGISSMHQVCRAS